MFWSKQEEAHQRKEHMEQRMSQLPERPACGVHRPWPMAPAKLLPGAPTQEKEKKVNDKFEEFRQAKKDSASRV